MATSFVDFLRGNFDINSRSSRSIDRQTAVHLYFIHIFILPRQTYLENSRLRSDRTISFRTGRGEIVGAFENTYLPVRCLYYFTQTGKSRLNANVCDVISGRFVSFIEVAINVRVYYFRCFQWNRACRSRREEQLDANQSSKYSTRLGENWKNSVNWMNASWRKVGRDFSADGEMSFREVTGAIFFPRRSSLEIVSEPAVKLIKCRFRNG